MKSDPALPNGTGGADAEQQNDSSQPDEDKAERLTRNLNELLQELRVMQTGVQILTGFLLTIPFTGKFGELTTFEQWVYLAVLGSSVVTTALIVAPVAFHRTLFRRGEREWIVKAAHRSANHGLVGLGATMAGVVWLVFNVVLGPPASHIAAGLTVGLFVILWGVLPVVSRRRFSS